MFFLKRCKVRSFEAGLHFRDGEFLGLLGAGTHWFLDPLGATEETVPMAQSTEWVPAPEGDAVPVELPTTVLAPSTDAPPP